MAAIDYRKYGIISHENLVSHINKYMVWEPKIKIGINAWLTATKWGRYSYISDSLDSARIVNCEIGRYVSIGNTVQIGMPGHPTDGFTTHPFPWMNEFIEAVPNYKPYNRHASPDKTIIEDGAWIGANTIIVAAKRTVIGRGSVVAAGSVVTKSVPPYAIVGGNPARVIRFRFDEMRQNKLDDSGWCDYDLPVFMANTGIHPESDEPTEFARWIERHRDLLEEYRIPHVTYSMIRNGDGVYVGLTENINKMNQS